MSKRNDQTSSVEGSPARTSATQGSAPASMERGPDSGQSSPASFAYFDPDTCSLKTSQLSLTGDSTVYSETWPLAGTMQSGRCFERPTLERPISGVESLFLPTPRANEAGGWQRDKSGTLRPTLDGVARGMWPTPTRSDGDRGPTMYQKGNPSLGAAVKMWPTPVRRDQRTFKGAKRGANSIGSEPLPIVAGGTLNPTWVEWLMGFQSGWTELDVSATPSSRSKRR
ncbi:hypothetical protein LCGC14_0320270 [marine sediment metagenome]|uniref:Uncharacterized protein n=1 Tax=marine sediment metagenome TaxID=412755 RepID=A0A0F9TQ21_9ZZZZ